MSDALSDWQIELLERGGLTISPAAWVLVTAEVEAPYGELLHDAFKTAEVAKLLQVSDSTVQRRRLGRKLWAVKSGSEWLFPTLQFIIDGSRQGQIQGLDKVVPALPKSLHPLAVAGFLTTPQPGLHGKSRLMSPLQWLRCGGDPRLVVEAAEAVRWMGI